MGHLIPCMDAARSESIKRYRMDVIEACKRLDLPLTVRSTAIQIFDKIVNRMFRDNVEMRDVVYITVVLASKCEEIHGNINTLMRRLPGSNKENMFNYEDEMFQILGYNFNFPSLYLRMYGILAILQEKELIKVGSGSIDLGVISGKKVDGETFVYEDGRCVVPCINKLWMSSVHMLDKILLLDKTEYREIELIYASLQLPCEVFNALTFIFNGNNVMRLRNICKVSALDSHEMEDSICV